MNQQDKEYIRICLAKAETLRTAARQMLDAARDWEVIANAKAKVKN